MKTIDLNEANFKIVKDIMYSRREKLMKDLEEVNFVVEQIKKIEQEMESDLSNTEVRGTADHSNLA